LWSAALAMTIDKTIFSLPFASRENLRPTPEQMNAFLVATAGATSQNQRGNDLAMFRGLLKSIDAFAHKQLPAAEQEDIQKQLFYSVLYYSQFAGQALLPALELFLYHMHALASIDFATPSSFIQSAQNTMGKLNKKKLDDVMRMVRLHEMVGERKEIIRKLSQSWVERAAELCRIALYIKDNLVKIEKCCEASIIMLSDRGVTGQKAERLIEDIKTLFKDQLKARLHADKVTKQEVENSLREANLLIDEMSDMIRKDIDALTSLYEALHDHVHGTIPVIETLLREIEGIKNKGPEGKGPLFIKLEHTLFSVLAVHRLEQHETSIPVATAREKLILHERKKMLDCLFEIVQSDRRSRTDRRSSGDRRKFQDPTYRGPERRSNKDRRGEKSRRGE
jgi:hypothetical protein